MTMTCTVAGCLCQKPTDGTGDWWIAESKAEPKVESYIGSYGRYVAAPKYRVEVRSDEDGVVDEVLLHDEDRCVMHLERMDRDSWWMGLYPGADQLDDDQHFNIVRDRKRVEVRPT
jgi:hypothetical protein